MTRHSMAFDRIRAGLGRDGRKAFDQITDLLDQLDPDDRQKLQELLGQANGEEGDEAELNPANPGTPGQTKQDNTSIDGIGMPGVKSGAKDAEQSKIWDFLATKLSPADLATAQATYRQELARKAQGEADDEPPPFSGRPKPGGGMDPIAASDESPYARLVRTMRHRKDLLPVNALEASAGVSQHANELLAAASLPSQRQLHRINTSVRLAADKRPPSQPSELAKSIASRIKVI